MTAPLTTAEQKLATQSPLSGIVDLADVSRAHLKSVGTKAALLGELCAAGLPVTPGLIVCAETCKGLRAAKQLSPKLLATLDAEIDRRWPDSTSFALRTSAIEGLRASEQNLRDTRCEYFVPRDALPIAIIAAAAAPGDVASSTHDSTAQANDSRGAIDRAVLIQPMVAAKVSGAVFTGALQAGTADSYLIEACWGLGRALVEEQTDPDRYQLDRNNEVLEQIRGRKQHQFKHDGSGLLVAVDEEDRLSWTLTSGQLAEITGLTKRCATVLGSAQDIEFAITDDGLTLLQSRPVTAAKLVPENVPAGKWLLYLPQLENFAEPFTPLSEDLLSGVLPDFAKLIHGRIYLDVAKLRSRLPVSASDAELTEALLYQQDLATLPLSFTKLLRCLPYWLSRGPWACIFWLRSRALTRSQMERFWAFANEEAKNKGLSAKTLFERFAKGSSPFTAPWKLPFALNAASSRYLVHMAVLHRLVRRWTHRELDSSTLQQLCTSNADTLSNDMVADIAALGRRVAQTPELVSAFDAPLDGLALHQLIDTSASRDFVHEFSAFVARFGHRGNREFELASARWLEEPGALLALIGIQSRQSGDTTANGVRPTSPDGYGLQLLARDDLHQAIRGRWRRWVIDKLLSRIRYYLSQRDNTRHYSARAIYLVRQRMLQVEDRLLQENKLEAPGDLFYLGWQDIAYLDHGQLSPDDAKTLIAAAKDQHAERCSGTLRWTLGYEPKIAQAPECASDSPLTGSQETRHPNAFDSVSGRCAAPGTCEGIARVVSNQRDLADFKPGEVLVLAYADPTVAAAVEAASGVICERGHAMSHLCTLAREWGVPFVIGAHNCTRAITTGERVRVIANVGRIDIVSEVNPDARETSPA